MRETCGRIFVLISLVGHGRNRVPQPLASGQLRLASSQSVHAAQRIGVGAERREGFHGLRVQAADLLLGCTHAEDGRVRRFAALAVGAGRLAERRGIGEHIEQIVLDLEREPDRGRESGERLREPRLERGRAGGAHHDTRPDERAGLEECISST